MVLRSLAVLVLLLGLVAVPTATAHIEPFSDARSLTVGPYAVTIDPRPSPLFAGTPTAFTLFAFDLEQRSVPESLTANVTWAARNGFEGGSDFEPAPGGMWFGQFTFPDAGNYTATLVLTDAAATRSGQVVFDVYPELGFRIVPADTAMDPVAWRPVTIQFLTVAPDSQAPVEALGDLRLRLEHWTPDHRTLLGAEETPLLDRGGGV